MRRALFTAACLLASVGVVAAALTPTGSRPSTEDGVLVASAGAAVEVAQTATTSTVPRPTTSTTLAPATTRVPPTTAPARSTLARQSTSTTAPPSFPVAPFPAGAEPFGMYGMGAAKTVTNGPDSVTMRVYPYDLSLGSTLQLSMEMAFVGGVKSVRFDYGDGTSVVHTSDSGGSPAWWCEDPITARKASSGGAPSHNYARAGTYRVTVTVTTVDCRGFMLPPWEVPGLPMTLPDGTPVAKRMGPVGQERVTTVSMDVVQRPDRYPLPRGPVPSP
ncbi:MAG: hypothetical protein Q8K72_12935 [Acidimicrobiales bacterium]|jgi:hypothetical protein|nr:hypothetical protein [Acidimicrobiales bacterium]